VAPPLSIWARDKLFGSVGTVDIVEALEKVQIEVERSEIRMPEGPIHTLGEYEIGIHLHSDVDFELPLTVVAEEAAAGD